MKKILFIFLVFLTTEVFSQSSFRTRMNIPYPSDQPALKSCIDGGYVLAGLRLGVWASDHDTCFIIKMDSSGAIEWQKKFLTFQYYGDRVEILSTPDSGFYVDIETPDSFVDNFTYSELMKLDKFGNITAQKNSYDPFITFSGEWMKFIEIEKDSGNLIVIGHHYYDDGNQNPVDDTSYIRKYDASFNVLFSKYIQGEGFFSAPPTAACKIYNSGIAAGYLVAGVDILRTSLYKFDNSAQVIWQKDYSFVGLNSNNYIRDMLQVDSAFYLLEKNAIRKIDYNGNTLYYKLFDTLLTNYHYSSFTDIALGDNNDLLIAGLFVGSSYPYSPSYHPCMLKTDMNGNVLDAKMGIDTNYVFAEIDTLTKGFLFVRYSSSSVEFEREFIDNPSCNFIPLTLPSTNGIIHDTTISVTTHTYNPPLFPASKTPLSSNFAATVLCSSVGINDVTEENNAINLFPNPFTSSLSITLQNQNIKQATISIKNILGQTVFEAPLPPSPRGGEEISTRFDLSFLEKGIYLLDIIIDREQTVKKVVKE
jgi:hypothetical protein